MTYRPFVFMPFAMLQNQFRKNVIFRYSPTRHIQWWWWTQWIVSHWCGVSTTTCYIWNASTSDPKWQILSRMIPSCMQHTPIIQTQLHVSYLLIIGSFHSFTYSLSKLTVFVHILYAFADEFISKINLDLNKKLPTLSIGLWKISIHASLFSYSNKIANFEWIKNCRSETMPQLWI